MFLRFPMVLLIGANMLFGNNICSFNYHNLNICMGIRGNLVIYNPIKAFIKMQNIIFAFSKTAVKRGSFLFIGFLPDNMYASSFLKQTLLKTWVPWLY